MTGIDERARNGRFGAATPGARQDRSTPDGLGGAQSPPAQRRWTRRGRLAAAAVVAVVAAAGYLTGRYITAPETPAVVSLAVTSVALPPGARLTAADLRVITVQAAAAPAGTLSPAGAAGVIGLVTKTPLPAGTLLSRSLLTPYGAVPGLTRALVGLALKPGQLPAGGLVPGQRVLVVLLPVTSSGASLAPISLVNTTVWDEQAPDSAGTVQATVVVPADLAVELTGYAARGQVTLVATSAGFASVSPSTGRSSTAKKPPATGSSHGHGRPKPITSKSAGH